MCPHYLSSRRAGSKSEGEGYTTAAAEDDYLLTLSSSWRRDAVIAVQALVLPKDPVNVREAMALPDADEWQEAIAKELDAFESRGIWAPAE